MNGQLTRRLGTLAAALLLAGCVNLAPDYQTPALPVPATLPAALAVPEGARVGGHRDIKRKRRLFGQRDAHFLEKLVHQFAAGRGVGANEVVRPEEAVAHVMIDVDEDRVRMNQRFNRAHASRTRTVHHDRGIKNGFVLPPRDFSGGVPAVPGQ